MGEWAAELLAQAIAMEREAAQRYAELAQAMTRQGQHAAAALFRMLAEHEGRHLAELRRRTAGMALPPLEADCSWPETIPLDALERGASTQRALAMALAAEKRAHAFFEQALRVARDAETRELARDMAAQEAEHAALIERMMKLAARYPADWRSGA